MGNSFWNLEKYLIGKDPRLVAHHWQAMYRHAFYRGGINLTSALSAVDIAMWDIKGKVLGIPIYKLLGGLTVTIGEVIGPKVDMGFYKISTNLSQFFSVFKFFLIRQTNYLSIYYFSIL